MSCPKTEHILQEYFSDDLSSLAGEEIEKHLQQCGYCSTELETLLQTQNVLMTWQDSSVPHWDRGVELYRREHKAHQADRPWFNIWQWLPTSVSFAMLCLLLLNTSISFTDDGFSVAFGAGGNSLDQELQRQLAEFKAQQSAELEATIVRFEDRQDANALQLMQAVMAQTQQTTADNLDQIFAYFEEQRLQDMQTLSLSYQQLADSDYATIQSLQDLAQFVSYQESPQ